MKIAWIFIASVILTTISRVFAQSAEGGEWAGYILRLTGGEQICISNTATYQSACFTKTAAADKMIFQHDLIYCDAGAVVTLNLRYGSETNLTATSWTQVPLEQDSAETDPRVRMAVKLMDSALKPADRPRGNGPSRVFQPANKSSVRLDQAFFIRWVPTSAHERLSLEVSSIVSDFNWQTNVDASIGEVELPQLLSQLSQEREQGNGQFTLHFRIGLNDEVTTEFNLLSLKQEQLLAAELKELPKRFNANGAAFHLIRAAVLEQHQLINESVVEYEHASGCIGEQSNPLLLRRAMEVCDQIGDTMKAGQYRLRLSKTTEHY